VAVHGVVPGDHVSDAAVAGIVTGIRRDPQDADAVQVLIDGRPALTLSLDQLVASAIAVGQAIDASRIAQLSDERHGRLAYRDAIARLSQRAQSHADLQRWLERRGHTADAADAALRRAVALGLVDDVQFASRWINERSAVHDRGPAALRAELRRHGIDPAVTDSLLSEHAAAHGHDAAVLRAARRGAARYATAATDPQTFGRRLSGWLLRRGFAPADVRRAVAQVWREGGYAGELADGAGD
jgi:regulatory protein